MPLKINDLILTDVFEVAGFDTITSKPIFLLRNCNDSELNSSSTTTKITAGRGAKVIAQISGQSELNLTINSATFDLNLLALQAGDKEGLYKTGASIIVPVFEKITIGSDSNATLKGTPVVDVEVTVLLDNGLALVEGDVASATEFSVTGSELTFDASSKNLSGTVFYYKTVTEAIEINLDAQAEISYVSILAECVFQDTCSGLNYLGYISIPRAGVDRNFAMAATKGGGESVHSVIFSAIAMCQNTELGKIYIYDEE